MTFLTSKYFWIRSLERAVKTFAQSLGASLGVLSIIDVDWKNALYIALSATLLSFLSSIGSTTVGSSDSPSLVEAQTEQQVIEKIEEGEPVGDPAVVIEPVVEQEYLDVQEEVVPVKKARRPRKKAQ